MLSGCVSPLFFLGCIAGRTAAAEIINDRWHRDKNNMRSQDYGLSMLVDVKRRTKLLSKETLLGFETLLWTLQIFGGKFVARH
jgi:hypothetical protein